MARTAKWASQNHYFWRKPNAWAVQRRHLTLIAVLVPAAVVIAGASVLILGNFGVCAGSASLAQIWKQAPGVGDEVANLSEADISGHPPLAAMFGTYATHRSDARAHWQNDTRMDYDLTRDEAYAVSEFLDGRSDHQNSTLFDFRGTTYWIRAFPTKC